MSMKKILLATAALFLFVATGFTTQDQAARNLQLLIGNHLATPQYSTFRILGGPYYWTCVRGERRSFMANLLAGKRYIFLASGDANSFDIDIRVYDPFGNIVTQDIITPQYDANGTPLQGSSGIDAGAWLAPTTSGAYRVEVDLHNTNAMAGIIFMSMCWGEF
jgi:hypothetical protein